jgi:hypothetical protein
MVFRPGFPYKLSHLSSSNKKSGEAKASIVRSKKISKHPLKRQDGAAPFPRDASRLAVGTEHAAAAAAKLSPDFAGRNWMSPFAGRNWMSPLQ